MTWPSCNGCAGSQRPAGSRIGIVPLATPIRRLLFALQRVHAETRLPSPRCPRCGHRKSWLLKNGRRRCARCRFDWRPGRLPLRLTPGQWRAVLRWFLRDVPGAAVARETRLDRKRVLRALMVVRAAIARDFAPGAAEPTWRSDGPPAPPVIGLCAAAGRGVWAEIVPEAEADGVRQAVRRRKWAAVSDRPSLSRYSALVYRGRFHRLGDRAPAGPGEIESFWSRLRRRLSRGGVRRSRLAVYLAEYSWRHRHRRLAPARQLAALLGLLRRGRSGGTNGT